MAANKEMPEVKKNDLTNREASALTDAEKSLALETKKLKLQKQFKHLNI